MKRITSEMPRARTDDLIIDELADETLVYDLKRHKAHCLNRTAAAVWRHCDGDTAPSEIARSLEAELDIPRDEQVVRFALDRLDRARLLEERTEVSRASAGQSRRELVRKLAVVGGAILLPMVTSITSPAAALAASSTTRKACRKCKGLGLPCRDRPGKTCVRRKRRKRRKKRCRCG